MKHFDDFTFLTGLGFWKGQSEECGVIVIVSKTPVPEKIEALAHEIMTVYHQEAILLTYAKAERVILKPKGSSPTIGQADNAVPALPLDFATGENSPI